jgi:LacI family gluconate utilization system Gnt-I transcriptional repressor
VETFEYDPNPIDVNVGFSNREAGAALAVYLIGRGRRRMAFVEHAGIDDSRMRARRNGFLDACAAAGLPGCRLFATAANPATALGGNIVDEIVATMPDVDAVSFAGHQIAAGALRHAVDRGIDVPGRMAIAAFGDSALAQWVRPALTTVRFAMAEMGAEAARLILARLAGAPIAVRTVNLGFEIVVRDSA